MSGKEDLIYIYLISIMYGVFFGQELACSGGLVGWIEYLGSILQRRETLALESIFVLWARILLFSSLFLFYIFQFRLWIPRIAVVT